MSIRENTIIYVTIYGPDTFIRHFVLPSTGIYMSLKHFYISASTKS